MRAIKGFFRKPFRWATLYGVALTLFFAFTLMDAFVIQKALVKVQAKGTAQASSAPDTAQVETEDAKQSASAPDESAASAPSDPVITATSYEDENIRITIETAREYDTTFYIADIVLSDATLLKTALAGDMYGRNIKDTTSGMAAAAGAIFAINGDYYGFRDYGYVIRNGVLYRSAVNAGVEALVIDEDGNLSIVQEGGVSAESLLKSGAWQVLSFGPALVEGGEIVVGVNQEISGQSATSNPRTAIGQVGELHYIVIVSDGRTASDAGLSLYRLAEQFEKRGCTVAYNLDGGGSSCMVFNGKVVNTTVNGGGKKGGRGVSSTSNNERQVSDIVYIGYE